MFAAEFKCFSHYQCWWLHTPQHEQPPRLKITNNAWSISQQFHPLLFLKLLFLTIKLSLRNNSYGPFVEWFWFYFMI